MQSSSDSGSVYTRPQVPGWRADATVADNGMRGWGAAISMLREQSGGQDSTGEGSNGYWYFGGNGSGSEQGRHVQDYRQTTSIPSRRPEGELLQDQGTVSQTTPVLQQGGRFLPQFTPQFAPQLIPQSATGFAPVQQ
jgi:hypothetical protein